MDYKGKNYIKKKKNLKIYFKNFRHAIFIRKSEQMITFYRKSYDHLNEKNEYFRFFYKYNSNWNIQINLSVIVIECIFYFYVYLSYSIGGYFCFISSWRTIHLFKIIKIFILSLIFQTLYGKLIFLSFISRYKA